MAVTDLGRVISISTRPNPGYTFRWSGKTGSICSSLPALRCPRHPLIARTPWPNRINIRGRQVAGTVHVHPNGRFVYAVNRASSTVESEGERVFAGGENTFAVYSINPTTGGPSLIQHVDTRGIYCRTFHIDPSGRLLVAAHVMPLAVREGAALRTVPASLALFRIDDDGKLDFVRKYDVDVGETTMFWMGMVAR
jgi:6-phosphogluconolactonase